MVKRVNILIEIFMMILIILVVIIYENINSSLNPHITLRKTINLPIKGSWTVSKYIFVGESSMSQHEVEKLLNKKAVFSGSEVKFNKQICSNPGFKIKIVDTKDYFENNFGISPEVLGIDFPQVKVITVFSNNNFFDDFIQINDDLMMRYSDGFILVFTRDGSIGNKMVENNIYKKDYRLKLLKGKQDIVSKSGIILGLKYFDKDSGGYDYRTLYISSSYNKIMPVLQRKNIFIPRKNGFWEIGVRKKYEDGMERDVLWGAPLMKNNSEIYNLNIINRDIRNMDTQIMFVGNEYISLDNKNIYSQNKYFSVVPIDNLNGKGIEFQKVFDNKSVDILKLSAEMYLKKIKKSWNDMDEGELSTNWAVTRRGGRWILRGRMDYGDFDIIYGYTKRNLSVYDDVYPGFDIVKRKVPDAVDAYTSPNRDFIVVLTKSALKVFILKGGNIGDMKLDFKLKNGESAVMSQWATGNYVYEWQKLFTIKNK